jgi:hypothetical protein
LEIKSLSYQKTRLSTDSLERSLSKEPQVSKLERVLIGELLRLLLLPLWFKKGTTFEFQVKTLREELSLTDMLTCSIKTRMVTTTQ